VRTRLSVDLSIGHLNSVCGVTTFGHNLNRIEGYEYSIFVQVEEK